MQKNGISWIKAVRLAFSTLTNMRIKPVEPDPDSVRKSLYFFPFAGLYIGLGATLVPVLACLCLGALQAFIIFTGCIYVFLLAWLSKFTGYRALARFSDAAALGKTVSPDILRQALHRDSPGAAGIACCALLAAAKMLIVYLLFTRAALFGCVTLLAFLLILAPFAARLLMLAACCKDPAPEEDPCSCAGKGGVVCYFYTGLLLVLTCGVSLVFFTLAHGFGEFIDLRSFSHTAVQMDKISAFYMKNGPMFRVFLAKGRVDVMILAAGGFLPLMYAAGEAKALFRGMTDEVIRALPEIAETSLLAAGLLIADYMLF